MGKHRDSDDEEEAPSQPPARSKDKKKGSDDEDDEGKSETPVNKNKRYRKDKPWDHEGIDHWKVRGLCLAFHHQTLEELLSRS